MLLPINLTLSQMQIRWKGIIDPVVRRFSNSVISQNSTENYSVSSPTQNSYYDVNNTFITLPSGNWRIDALCLIQGVTISGAVLLYAGILDFQNNVIQSCAVGVSSIDVSIPLYFTAFVELSDAKSFKLSIKWLKQTGSPSIGSIASRGDLMQGGCFIAGSPT